ncbi:MAG: restriction endonuclease subunit S [Candidatus Omnitrophica bacterium]|nr:restriction endonuclease subunit S [Candidatus Omnitrophota bacterium]
MENKLPEGWEWKELLSIIDYQGGNQPPKKEFVYEPQDGYVRLLQIRDFGNKPFPTYVPDSHKLKKVSKKDILLARYGGASSSKDSLGRVCEGFDGAYNVALAKLIFSEKELNRDYVKYLFFGPWFLATVSKNSRSCQKGFNKDDLKGIKFPIAPPSEQKRIADKLDVLLEKVKNAQSRLNKISLILKRFRQSVVEKVFSDISEEKLVMLGDALPKRGIFDGPFGSNLKTVDYTSSGVRVVRLENIGRLKFIEEKESYISNEKYKTLLKHTVNKAYYKEV